MKKEDSKQLGGGGGVFTAHLTDIYCRASSKIGLGQNVNNDWSKFLRGILKNRKNAQTCW